MVTPSGNVLLVTLDQLSADALTGGLSTFVPTPNIDRLAATGISFEKHFTVTVPCGPARASLLTGLYAMNHRALRNGTPLAAHHATIATEARRAGYEPLLFGYTDISPDPGKLDPEDPDLHSYEGIAPGFREMVEMRLDDGLEWLGWLRSLAYSFDLDRPGAVAEIFKPVTPIGSLPRPSDPALYDRLHSDTAYLTDRTLMALDIRRSKPWFAHISYIRPHPPFVAPEPFNRLIDPAALPNPNINAPHHPFVEAWFSQPSNTGLYYGFDGHSKKMALDITAELRAIYLGLVAEVDHHIGRILDWLDVTGQAERTLVVLTADHGDMLGAKGMWGKESVFDPAFHVPLTVRDPRTRSPGRVSAITESVDVAPTILSWIGLTPPDAMDGRSLMPLMTGNMPDDWRDSVFMEADFGHPGAPTRFQSWLGLRAEQATASILREERWKYVHFGGGVPPMLFDLWIDPEETQNLADRPEHAQQLSRLARKLIDRMTERRDRRLTQFSIGS